MKQKISRLNGTLVGALAGLVGMSIQRALDPTQGRPYSDVPYWFGTALGGALVGLLVIWVINRRRV